MALAAARPRPGSSIRRRAISARPASSASRRIMDTSVPCFLPGRTAAIFSVTARRSMIARRFSMSNRLIARSRSLSADKASPAPRAGSSCRAPPRQVRRQSGRRVCSGSAAANNGRSSRPAAIPPVASRPASSLASTERRAGDDGWRQPRKLGHRDPVAAVGGAFGDFVEEHQIALPFARADMVKRQAIEPSGKPGQLVVMGREQGPAAARRRASPRPPPRQSRARRRSRCRGRSRRGSPGCCGVAWARIAAVSTISTMKVERPRARLSAAPTRLNRRSTIPTLARAAGTKLPAWASTAISAVWRRKVDLPPMLGPVISHSRSSGPSDRSLATNRSPVSRKRAFDHRVPARVDLEARLVGQLGQRPAALGRALGVARGDVDPRHRFGGRGDPRGARDREAR